MVLAVVALVFALPQLVGYLVVRLGPRAGPIEWLGAVVAAYTLLWYPAFGRSLRHASGSLDVIPSAVAWGMLVVGLLFQLVIGGVLATAYFRRKRALARAAHDFVAR